MRRRYARRKLRSSRVLGESMTFGNGDADGRPPATTGFDFQLTSSGPSTTSEGSAATHDFGLTSTRASGRRRQAVDTRGIGLTAGILIGVVALLAAAAFTGWTLVQNAEADVKADSAA